MKDLVFNYNGVLDYVSKKEIAAYEDKAKQALKDLIDNTGAGNDFTGWVNYPLEIQEKELQEINEVAKNIRKQSHCLVVIGIGGSYLGAKAAIEMFSPYFSNLTKNNFEIIFLGNNISAGYLEGALKYLKNVDFSVNVISKSGKTLEPALAFRFVKELMIEKYGAEYAKRVVVTTSNHHSILHEEALKEGYKEFFIPDNIGGRYSVFTAVGLLPIACMGYDVYDLIRGAINSCQDFKTLPYQENPCMQYATIRNILYNKKYTNEIMASFDPKLTYFGEWWKQLYGESEGKDHKGVLPVVLSYSTDLHSLGQYVQDGMRNIFETFVDFAHEKTSLPIKENNEDLDGLNYLAGKDVKFVKDQALKGTMEAHISGGVPAMLIQVKDNSPYTFGYLAYFFMLSCGISGYLLGVNPFNQEGVEAYKKNMYALLKK